MLTRIVMAQRDVMAAIVTQHIIPYIVHNVM